jgi:hypothetical protein
VGARWTLARVQRSPIDLDPVSQGSHVNAPSLVAKACAQASFGAFRIEIVGLRATIRQVWRRSAGAMRAPAFQVREPVCLVAPGRARSGRLTSLRLRGRWQNGDD